MSSFFCFFMVWMRFFSLLTVVPLFGDVLVPGLLKILFSLSVSCLIYPFLEKSGVLNIQTANDWQKELFPFLKILFSEIFFGFFLGFVSHFVFYGLQTGAHWIGNFMGFSIANVYDVHQESQTQIVAQFQYALIFLFFLSFNGHHFWIQALVKTYSVLSLGQFSFDIEFLKESLIQFSQEILIIALQLSAPFGVAHFFIQLVFGLLSRAVPQVNIFSLSLGVTAGLGIWILLIWNSFFSSYVMDTFSTIEKNFVHLMNLIRRHYG